VIIYRQIPGNRRINKKHKQYPVFPPCNEDFPFKSVKIRKKQAKKRYIYSLKKCNDIRTLVYHGQGQNSGECMKRNDEGFTGLEAAIVLIAFVVVAAVFSYAVISAGFFTTQKAQETMYKGLEQSTSNIQLIGNVYGLSNDTTKGISEIRFSVGLGPGASSVDLSKFTVIFSTPTTSPKSLTWTSGSASQGSFTTKINGVGSSVSSLDVNQQVEFDFLTEYVPANSRMNIELHPSVGASLPFSKATPATIARTNFLY